MVNCSSRHNSINIRTVFTATTLAIATKKSSMKTKTRGVKNHRNNFLLIDRKSDGIVKNLKSKFLQTTNKHQNHSNVFSQTNQIFNIICANKGKVNESENRENFANFIDLIFGIQR